jgi:hypothetical protein
MAVENPSISLFPHRPRGEHNSAVETFLFLHLKCGPGHQFSRVRDGQLMDLPQLSLMLFFPRKKRRIRRQVILWYGENQSLQAEFNLTAVKFLFHVVAVLVNVAPADRHSPEADRPRRTYRTGTAGRPEAWLWARTYCSAASAQRDIRAALPTAGTPASAPFPNAFLAAPRHAPSGPAPADVPPLRSCGR